MSCTLKLDFKESVAMFPSFEMFLGKVPNFKVQMWNWQVGRFGMKQYFGKKTSAPFLVLPLI